MSPDQTAISGVRQAASRPGDRPETLGGAHRIVPVAERDERPAMHQLALLARIARRAVGPHHQDLGVRDRLADGVGPPIDLGRIEVGRAERLGESVHEERLRRRERPRAACPGSAWASVRRCSRSSAVDARASCGHVCVGDLDPQRRNAGQAGDPVPRAEPRHVARQQVVHQDHMRADRERGRQLAESGIEAQRQRGRMHVVGGVLQVRGHALGAGDQVAVAEHHALRLARAS